jgi:hypothetical protein
MLSEQPSLHCCTTFNQSWHGPSAQMYQRELASPALVSAGSHSTKLNLRLLDFASIALTFCKLVYGIAFLHCLAHLVCILWLYWAYRDLLQCVSSARTVCSVLHIPRVHFGPLSLAGGYMLLWWTSQYSSWLVTLQIGLGSVPLCLPLIPAYLTLLSGLVPALGFWSEWLLQTCLVPRCHSPISIVPDAYGGRWLLPPRRRRRQGESPIRMPRLYSAAPISSILSGCWFISTQTGSGLVFDALMLWYDPSPIYNLQGDTIRLFPKLLRVPASLWPRHQLSSTVVRIRYYAGLLVGSSSHSTISCAAV